MHDEYSNFIQHSGINSLFRIIHCNRKEAKGAEHEGRSGGSGMKGSGISQEMKIIFFSERKL